MRIVLAVLVLASLAACAHQPPPLGVVHAPGFWIGLWHGLIAPIALVGSIFTNVRMYASPTPASGTTSGSWSGSESGEGERRRGDEARPGGVPTRRYGAVRRAAVGASLRRVIDEPFDHG